MFEMPDSPTEEVLRAHRAYVRSDTHPFMRATRLRQVVWREKQGFPVGVHRGKPLGSRLEMPGAAEHLWNYLSDGIRKTVRVAVADRNKFIKRPRIYEDLLSSQPLCFALRETDLYVWCAHQRTDAGRRARLAACPTSLESRAFPKDARDRRGVERGAGTGGTVQQASTHVDDRPVLNG
jgi:hypothetical protein